MASPNPPGNSDFDRVLEEGNQFVRTLILNRPRQLNALSSTMISQLLELLVSYEEDRDVKLIILKGKGRAFCAGGDVPALVHGSEAGKWRSGAEFFRLNYLIATYSKPQVSILNGITMGGGVGVSVHGRFRVATENTVYSHENILGLLVRGWMVLKCLHVVLQLILSILRNYHCWKRHYASEVPMTWAIFQQSLTNMLRSLK